MGLGGWGCGIGRERVHVWGIGTYAEKSCSLARVVPGCCGGLYDRCTPVHGGDGCVGRYGHEQAVQGVGCERCGKMWSVGTTVVLTPP